MANQPTNINGGGPVFITNIFTTAPQSYPMNVGSTYEAQAAHMRPDYMGNVDDMNAGEYYTAQQPNAASMSQGVPWEGNQNVPYEFGTPRERTAQPDNAAWTPVEPVEVPMSPEFANGPQVADDDEACDMALTPTASEFDVQTPVCEFDDLTCSPDPAETPQEGTAQSCNLAWTPVEPVEVPMNPEFANGPQAVGDDEACDTALTPTASEFDVQTPAWEFNDLTRSPERAETPPADTPMRQFEASLPMGNPAEAAARVNFFQDSIQEEVDTDVQTPVPAPGTERARLNAEFPRYPGQEFQMLDEDVMWATPDILTPGQEQAYSAATPGWTWEETATPDITEQAPSSPCDSLTFDREAFSAALQDAIAEGTGMDMAEDKVSCRSTNP